MNRTYITLVFCLFIGEIFAQDTNGDYRTAVSGNWNQVATWEVYNGGWVALNNSSAGPYQNVIPTNVSGVISVRHNVTITQFINFNNVIVESPSILRINAGITARCVEDNTNTPLEIRAGAFLHNFGILDLQSQLTATPCQISGEFYGGNLSTVQITNPSLLMFNSGGRYRHVHVSGGNIPLATWNVNSTCIINGLNQYQAPAVPGNLNQAFGNFTWDTPALGSSPSFSLAGKLTTVNGSLSLRSTNNRAVRFSSLLPGYNLVVGGNVTIQTGTYWLSANQSSASSLTIGGDLIIQSGNVVLGTYNSSAMDILLNGNFIKTGGTIKRGEGTGLGTIHFNGTGSHTYSNNLSITSAINFSVENGSTLDMGTSFLTGSGRFTLNTGGTLILRSIEPLGALQLGSSGGNIRTTGIRTYQTGSTVIYGGAGTQFMAAGHPAAVNTTISNSNHVYMVSSATINGLLNLLDGALIIDGHTLTLGGTIAYVNGYLGIIPQSNVVINGSGNFGTLLLAPVLSQAPPNSMNNLTINRTGGTVTLGLNLIVGGTLNLANGVFLIGQAPGWVLTLRGNFAQTAGVLSTFDNPDFIIEGSGTMPANVNITGTGFEKLTMNRAARTFSTSAPLVITDSLNLFNGTVNHPSSNITMGSNATITRRSGGMVNQILGAESSYNVTYDVATPITTGNELPFPTPVTTTLGDLTKLGAATVTLNHDIIVNGNFNLVSGIFDVGTGNDVGINGNLIVDGTFQTQQGLVTFGGGTPQTISGVSPITFFDVVVNKTSSSSLTLANNISVQNNLAINSATTINAGTERLRLLSTSTRTANLNSLAPGASIAGRVIVDRFLPNADGSKNYRFLSTPVSNSNMTDWREASELPITAAYRYNEPTTAYVAVSTSVALTPGRGYSVYVNSASQLLTFDTRGTLNQGNIAVPLTSQSSDVESPQGFNLVGNPYPSAISWFNISLPGNGSIFNAMYITDNFNNSGQGSGVNSVSYVDGVSTPAGFTGQIAQGQAFWVKATANTILSFTEAAKITPTNTQFYRLAEIADILRITIEGNGRQSETVLRLREGATSKFDPKFDAQTFFQSELSLSTLTADNVKTVINAFSLNNCVGSIPLVPQGVLAGSYHFNFAGLESFDGQVDITLMDAEENKVYDLRKLKEYHFTISEQNINTLANRFRISIQGKDAIDIAPVVLTAEGTTLISSVEEGNQWYFNDTLLEGETSNSLIALEPGVYSVKIAHGGCTSDASHEISEEDLNIYPTISVYPNPTRNKVLTRVKTTNNNVHAVIVNSSGMEIETMELTGDGGVKEGEFDLVPHASGIYYLKIFDGSKMYIRKVAKVK